MSRRRRKPRTPTAQNDPRSQAPASAERTRDIEKLIRQTMEQLYGGASPRRAISTTPKQQLREQPGRQRQAQRPATTSPKPAARPTDARPKQQPKREARQPQKKQPAPQPAKKPEPRRQQPSRAPEPARREARSAPRGISPGNFAFIDGTNLNVSIRHLGWHMDYAKFRAYLEEKYNVTKAYYFLGFLEEHQEIYDFLKAAGFELVFKPAIVARDGTVKGNIDAELVLQAMIDLPNYDKAVIVTGDGDFACLVRYLREQKKLEVVLAPNSARYSSLLKTEAASHIAFVNRLRARLMYAGEKKEKKA